MEIIQSRIKANTVEKAIEKIRKKFNQYENKLTLRKVPWLENTFEYRLVLKGQE